MIKIGEFKADIQHHFDANGKEVTVAQIFDKDEKLLTRAKVSRYSSDRPSKKEGMKKAFAKALTGSKIPKKKRAEFWEGFRTMTKVPRW